MSIWFQSEQPLNFVAETDFNRIITSSSRPPRSFSLKTEKPFSLSNINLQISGGIGTTSADEPDEHRSAASATANRHLQPVCLVTESPNFAQSRMLAESSGKRRRRPSRLRQRGHSYVEYAKNAASIATAVGCTIIIHYFRPWQENSLLIPEKQRVEGWQLPTLNIYPDPTLGWWNEPLRAKAMPGIRRYVALKNITKQISQKLEEIHIPQIVENPPPPVFLAACISFAFAITAFRYSHRHDSFQDHIVGTSVIIGIVAASVSEDFLRGIKTAIPWSVIFALVLSSLLHRIVSLTSTTKININRGIAEESLWTESGKG
ncbi:hypothetical protein F5884DRAFT_849869 [Xylogone sp. PMI_703]|nr:hypothetical protein F5884DRAFT_849869 [Xylogone sp. PMI_703]